MWPRSESCRMRTQNEQRGSLEGLPAFQLPGSAPRLDPKCVEMPYHKRHLEDLWGSLQSGAIFSAEKIERCPLTCKKWSNGSIWKHKAGWWFGTFFHRLGAIIPFHLTNIFQKSWNHQPERIMGIYSIRPESPPSVGLSEKHCNMDRRRGSIPPYSGHV